MNDLDRRFREAEGLEVDDIWPQIEGRHPLADIGERHPHRVLAVVTAFMVAAVGVTLAVLALGGGKPREEPVVTPSAVPSPIPTTAFQLATAIRKATGQCADIEAPFGIPPQGASGWIQCHFHGTVLDLLSFDATRSMPSHSTGLHGRVEIIGSRWFADADNLDVARRVQAVVGGRIWIAPRYVQPVVELKPQCPERTLCTDAFLRTVRFGLRFTNPLDRAARMTCFARGLAGDKVTLSTRKLRGPQLPGGASASLGELIRLSSPANVTKIVAWCEARPVHQFVT